MSHMVQSPTLAERLGPSAGAKPRVLTLMEMFIALSNFSLCPFLVTAWSAL